MSRGSAPATGGGKEIRQIVAAVSGCFFLSGGTGLIYEVLWTRMLGLVFGHTVFAITTVLTAFMAGLGLGSYLFGRLADRQGHPLRLYGFLEAGIGLYALLTPILFSQAEGIYIPLHQSFNLSFAAFSLSQFALTFLILLVPTTLMGATLPVMSRFYVHEIRALGSDVGWLYALNTFGALLGAYTAGFYLIPVFGLRTSLLLAAVTNVGIGVLAIAFDRHLLQIEKEPSESKAEFRISELAPESPPGLPGAPPRPVATWLAVAGLGLSGAASMMYEVTWTRALSLILGSSTYAFSTMLVAFLGGLALGSYLFSRLAGRLRVDTFLFGALQLGIGLSALAVMPFFDRLPEVFLRAFALSQSPAFVKALQFGISVLAMLLPTLFMGATFPCVAQIASSAMRRLARDVGRVYFINTGGAIAGTALAGFVFIPTIGLQPTLNLAVSTNLALALALFVVAGSSTWLRRLAMIPPVLALVTLYLVPAWDAKAMASGVAIYGRNYLSWLGKADFREVIGSVERLLYYKDGISTTVSVHQRGDALYLKVNGKTDASNGRDMHTQLMVGHLPLLFHPDPKRVLVVGLGSGVTAGAVALYPVEAVEVVEIEPAVVEAAGYFAKENRRVLKDPRLRIAIADGRNHLLAWRTQYDVIISEPSNPWLKGIGNLFSLEFYQLAARRLGPEGIICQWIQAYGLYPEDLKMVVKTFRSVFPHTTIWSTQPGDVLLIGSKEPLVLDGALLRLREASLPGLREDLARLGFPSALSLLADFVLGERDAARYSRHAWLNTDDLPLLEFSAPESLFADTVDLNRRLLQELRQEEFPPIVGLAENGLRSAAFRRDLGLAFLAKGMADEALVQFEAALRLDPRDPESLHQRGRLHLRSGAVLKAEADYKSALGLAPGRAEIHESLGQLYKAQRVWEMAETHLREAVALSPTSPRLLAQLADLYREGQRSPEAIPHYLAAIAMAPDDASLWGSLGLSYQTTGLFEEARGAFLRARELRPESSLYEYLSGLAYLALKQTDKASASFEAATRKIPLRVEPHLELGRLHLAQGKKEMAIAAFRQALRLEPRNPVALKALEELSAPANGS
jgi:spermidine synthase